MTNRLKNNCNNHIEQYQAMKFGQLIEHSMRNTFFEKPYTQCGRHNIPKPFSENSRLSITRDHNSFST